MHNNNTTTPHPSPLSCVQVAKLVEQFQKFNATNEDDDEAAFSAHQCMEVCCAWCVCMCVCMRLWMFERPCSCACGVDHLLLVSSRLYTTLRIHSPSPLTSLRPPPPHPHLLVDIVRAGVGERAAGAVRAAGGHAHAHVARVRGGSGQFPSIS
jgi:hypothetical protein